MTSPLSSSLQQPFVFRRSVIQAALRAYMRVWHRLTVEGRGRLPSAGPALVVGNHTSFLDLPVYMAVDPSPDSAVLVLASMLRKPVITQTLRAWNAIPVLRDGKDVASMGALFEALAAGKVVIAAAEGRRTRSARFEGIHPTLAFMASRAGVPVIPLAVIGSFKAMPYGKFFPRPVKVSVRVGEPVTFTARSSASEAAERLSAAIDQLLPAEQRRAQTSP